MVRRLERSGRRGGVGTDAAVCARGTGLVVCCGRPRAVRRASTVTAGVQPLGVAGDDTPAPWRYTARLVHGLRAVDDACRVIWVRRSVRSRRRTHDIGHHQPTSVDCARRSAWRRLSVATAGSPLRAVSRGRASGIASRSGRATSRGASPGRMGVCREPAVSGGHCHSFLDSHESRALFARRRRRLPGFFQFALGRHVVVVVARLPIVVAGCLCRASRHSCVSCGAGRIGRSQPSSSSW